MKLLYMGIFFRFIFCVSDASFAAESSIIPFQLSPSSKPMLHLGGLQDKNGINLVSGIQIQPTNNLLLGGVISPRNYENDLSLYYHILIGYVPKACNVDNSLINDNIIYCIRLKPYKVRRWTSWS